MDADEKCKEAFIAAGFWPNEVMWSAWRNAWTQATASANERIKELEAELKHEEQRIADLIDDVNRQGHDLAAERAVLRIVEVDGILDDYTDTIVEAMWKEQE